jgi:hypothetical protein
VGEAMQLPCRGWCPQALRIQGERMRYENKLTTWRNKLLTMFLHAVKAHVITQRAIPVGKKDSKVLCSEADSLQHEPLLYLNIQLPAVQSLGSQAGP